MLVAGIRGVCAVVVAILALQTTAAFSPFRRTDSEGHFRGIVACQSLRQRFPQLVSFSGSEQYINDTVHSAISSEQNSVCSVEPINADDVSAIIKIIGKPNIRAPFAVKSGGHAYNLGQSSTPGVQVSMSRFNNISYNSQKKTVTVGVGLTWGEVHKRLEPLGVMVTGGRINGIGVGGFSLGGGYSWKTNQYGLLIDTVVSYQVVLPSGELAHVTNTSDPDLFFALKASQRRGGLNNFGIVTEIELEAHDQTLVFGGILAYSSDVLENLNNAISKFSQNNTDPKAQMMVVYASLAYQLIAQILLFYDAPQAPPGVYDQILSLPAVSSDVKTRTFVEFMAMFGDGDLGIGRFGIAQHVVPIVHYTKPVLDEMVAQVLSFGTRLTEQNNGSTVVISIAPEPFFDPFSHSRGGAYPHPASRQVTPASSYIAYQESPDTPLADRIARHAIFVKEIKSFTHNIQSKAVEDGQSRWDDILYPNYALIDTPLELMYGGNVQRLRKLAAKYDPDRVMTLTGGFDFQT